MKKLLFLGMKTIKLLRWVMPILIFLMTSMPTIAQESKDCIVIHMKSGNKVLAKIEEQPKLVLEKQVLTLKTEHYQISEIIKYTFGNYDEEISTGINSPNMPTSFTDGFVYVKAKSSKSEVKVCSINGIVQNVDARKHSNGLIEVDLRKLASGVYLLYIDGECLKIQKQ